MSLLGSLLGISITNGFNSLTSWCGQLRLAPMNRALNQISYQRLQTQVTQHSPVPCQKKMSMKTVTALVAGLVLVDPALVLAEGPKVQEPMFQQMLLFERGTDGYHVFRIPALVVSERGTVLAFCEAGAGGLALRRSLDGGQTWTDMRIIVAGGPLKINNPCPVVDDSTGTIWLSFCRGKEPEPGHGNAEIVVIKSTDNGVNWSNPVNISESAMDPSSTWVGTGPGHGIQLKTGRLLIPCWADSTPRHGEIQSSYCFYSDDHGATWKLGQPLTRNASDECDVVELADRSIYLNARSRQGKRQRAYAFSKDGGHSWSEVQYDPGQPEPSCDGGLIRLTDTTRFLKNRVLVAASADPKYRTTMTVRLSYDECRTWPVSKVINPGASSYADLAVNRNNEILCLYEVDNEASLALARFNLAWLTDGKDSLVRID